LTTRTEVEAALKRLKLFGCLARLDEIENEPWLARLVTLETEEKTRRTLENRTRVAGLGSFKELCDFDWVWPKKIDRVLIEELLTLRFVARAIASKITLFQPAPTEGTRRPTQRVVACS
jgi:hypothetical protein